MSQEPTCSKYVAKSSLVTGPPSPASGQSALSGLEIRTPMTTSFPEDLGGRAGNASLDGAGTSVLVGLAGFSASTSSAALSSRRPLNAACRTMPSPVQPANSISATSSGFVQVTPASLRGAPIPVNGDFAAATDLRRGRRLLTF